YTDVRPIAETSFRPAGYNPEGLTPEKIQELTYDDTGAVRLVFVNGLYSRELSSVPALPDGVRVETLTAALESTPDFVMVHLARHALTKDNAFVALNASLFEDGPLVRIPRGLYLDTPIHLVYVSTTAE